MIIELSRGDNLNISLNAVYLIYCNENQAKYKTLDRSWRDCLLQGSQCLIFQDQTAASILYYLFSR